MGQTASALRGVRPERTRMPSTETGWGTARCCRPPTFYPRHRCPGTGPKPGPAKPSPLDAQATFDPERHQEVGSAGVEGIGTHEGAVGAVHAAGGGIHVH